MTKAQRLRQLKGILVRLNKLRADEIYDEVDSLVDSAYNGVQMAIIELEKENEENTKPVTGRKSS